MTKISLESALPKSGGQTLIAGKLWQNLGGTYLAVVEVHVSERTEPDDQEKECAAKLRVDRIEIAQSSAEQAELRRLLARYRQAHTSAGTLDDVVDLDTGELVDQVVEQVNAGALGPGVTASAKKARR